MQMSQSRPEALIEAALVAIEQEYDGLTTALNQLPAPIYVTDKNGVITHFNDACIALAGRTPVALEDRWCVTWKIFQTTGEFLPHDRCPMAVAVHEKRAIRGVEAIAERPDGTRVNFAPYPTPFFDADGELAGAVNLLLDVTASRKSAQLRVEAARCRRLAGAMGDRATAETLTRMADEYDAEAAKMAQSN
jgi:PAS domain S-box-containing protein